VADGLETAQLEQGEDDHHDLEDDCSIAVSIAATVSSLAVRAREAAQMCWRPR
jgi:hypothetical protein